MLLSQAFKVRPLVGPSLLRRAMARDAWTSLRREHPVQAGPSADAYCNDGSDLAM